MKKESILQLVIVILGVIGVTINFMLYNDWRGIFYYTILSNIFVTIFYAVTLVKKIEGKLVKSNRYYGIKGLMLLMILCTMFVYFAAVSSKDSIYTGHPVECYLVHIVIPILALFECFVFEDKGVLKYKYVLIWCITSVIYMFVLIAYNNLFNGKFLEGKAYPYDVINYENIGILQGTINSLVILVFFVITGCAIVYIDNKMASLRRK